MFAFVSICVVAICPNESRVFYLLHILSYLFLFAMHGDAGATTY